MNYVVRVFRSMKWETLNIIEVPGGVALNLIKSNITDRNPCKITDSDGNEYLVWKLEK